MAHCPDCKEDIRGAVSEIVQTESGGWAIVCPYCGSLQGVGNPS